ncbi:Seizure 6-like protein, partial [Characodon lateralis]|nr:Seizure 6-like protein [Characodon lateralis]
SLKEPWALLNWFVAQGDNWTVQSLISQAVDTKYLASKELVILFNRLVLWSGLDAGSVVLFDSGRGGQIPFEGVISEGPAVRVQFITDQPNHETGFTIRYEAFERGHCYEPYLQNGNFTTSDLLYGVGAVVQFTCDPGHSLEQGPPVIECISARDPYWNDTEPLCKGKS